MAALELSFVGMNAMLAKLAQVGDTVPGNFARALRQEAEIEMTEAKKRTPVKTGALRASGVVVGPVRDGQDYVVAMGFGQVPSVAAGYAVEVHENLHAFHHVGQAKFLESVLLESAPYLPARVAERMRTGAGAWFQPSASELSDNADEQDVLMGE